MVLTGVVTIELPALIDEDYKMGIWSNQASSVDGFISDSVYGGAFSEAEGIDLRLEIHAILYGGLGRKPKGHWVVYRRFDRCTPSKYWNEDTKEGVGGPGYSYSDEILKTRRMPAPRSETDDRIKAGTVYQDEFVYYLEYTVTPKIGDYIYELNWNDHRLQPSSSQISLDEKLMIHRVHPYRLENGNIQYWAALCRYDEIRY